MKSVNVPASDSIVGDYVKRARAEEALQWLLPDSVPPRPGKMHHRQ